MEDRYMRAVRIAMRALEMIEARRGEPLRPEEKFTFRAQLVEEALRLLESREA
jgi:DNA-directed RNA polymerase subunit K/omega